MEKTQAEVRKDIYEYLEAQGFEITDERHKALKGLLKFIEETKVEIPAQEKKEHEVVCPKCGGRKLYKGKKWRQEYNKEFDT